MNALHNTNDAGTRRRGDAEDRNKVASLPGSPHPNPLPEGEGIAVPHTQSSLPVSASPRPRVSTSPLVQLAGLCLLAVIPACAEPHGVECRDIPMKAIPAPPGTYVCQWTAAEATRAEADKFVFYQYEWQRDQAQLGPFGQRHAAQVAERLPCVPYSVVIEPSDDAALDESRRLAIHQTLTCQGQNVPLERIVVGHSTAEPLYSQEAPAIARGMFTNQTGTGSTGGFGGGGGAGGGIGGGIGVGGGIGGGGIGVGGMSGGTTSFGGY